MWPSLSWVGLCLMASSIGALADEEDDYKSISLKTHTLVSPYLDSELQSRWFDFGGDAIIRTDRYIRLTSDRPSQAGYVFSRVPLTATNWEIELEFQIHGQHSLFGDGMAMWITKQRAQQGTVFGSTDKFEGLGIFFDTYKNNRPGVVFPYVMAMVGDGSTSYDKDNDGKSNELAGCSARGLRSKETTAKARLTYLQDKNLKLELQYKADGEWTLCFDVPKVKIPSVAYLGFSAETGELSDNHDIIKVETKNIYSPSTSARKTDQPKAQELKSRKKGKGYDPNKGSKSGGSWTWFFMKFIIFGVVITLAYVGFTMYRTSKRGSRF